MIKKKRYWKIQGWDSTTKLFEHKIAVGVVPDIKILLKVLTAKVALTEEEIISSFVKKGTKSHCDHLVIQNLQGNKFMWSCGSNPYVIAVVEEQ